MRITITLFVALVALSVSAQIGRKELRTDSGLVVLHHFKNGGVSTKEWTDKDHRWGRSTAYDRAGKEIFSYHTRRVGGHATAHFNYHPNGAVSKVEVSDAPDAGIQWYKSTTTFDEEGRQTGFFEYGRDNDGIIPRISLEPQKRVVPVYEQEVVQCQRMFVNELFVVNPTVENCHVVALAKRPSPALSGGVYKLAPGDTLRLGTYSMGELFPEPYTAVDLDIHQLEPGVGRKAVARYRVEHVQVSPEHRSHYVVIEGWISSRDEPTMSPAKEEAPKPVRKRFRLRFW